MLTTDQDFNLSDGRVSPAPDVLVIQNAEGANLLRIDSEGNWVWPENAQPEEAALIFARTVEELLRRPR